MAGISWLMKAEILLMLHPKMDFLSLHYVTLRILIRRLEPAAHVHVK